MCGIGSALVKVDCEAVAGSTDATITTEAPCTDTYSNCADLCRYEENKAQLLICRQFLNNFLSAMFLMTARNPVEAAR